MADFNIAVGKTIDIEKGYANDPNDYGGETKYGISKRSYPATDIVKLDVEGAKVIYKRDFWDKMGLDAVASQAVAEEVFDTGVNCGWRVSAKMLQSSINLFLLGLDSVELVVDGLVGSKTLKALRRITRTQLNLDVLLKLLNGFQLQHYINLVQRDPSYHTFMKGWIAKRIDMKGIEPEPVEGGGESGSEPDAAGAESPQDADNTAGESPTL